jgi:hypothetical protein
MRTFYLQECKTKWLEPDLNRNELHPKAFEGLLYGRFESQPQWKFHGNFYLDNGKVIIDKA